MCDYQKGIKDLKSDVTKYMARNKELEELCREQADHLQALTEENSTLKMRVKECDVAARYADDRATVAATRQRVAELRQQELEASVDAAIQICEKMKVSLEEVDVSKQRALRDQIEQFEAIRITLVDHYEKREGLVRDEFRHQVQEIQGHMVEALQQRERTLSEEFEHTLSVLDQGRREADAAVERRRSAMEAEHKATQAALHREKEVWMQQQQNEIDGFVRRVKEREEWALNAIAQRERDVVQREERLRAEQCLLQQESEAKVARREEALRLHYERAIEDMQKGFQMERQKLNDAFLEQVQKLSNLHCQNEREMERMHRERERELSRLHPHLDNDSGSKISPYTLQSTAEHGSDMDRGSSILSALDSIEMRQQKRAVKLRSALGDADHATVSNNPENHRTTTTGND
ncbi:hypothetical protein STCU_04451 [Strigomonas culicis]|nr:hypothetical protein STCU_04451 [Strigomonas culicis]|eukprot:EPY29570.1 hypothetical protein STCU_04451 [Strigomonas culicis]